MATKFALRNLDSTLGGAGQLLLSQRNGRSFGSAVTTTTAGGTDIQVTTSAGGQALTWFTEPIAEAVTISSTVTVRISGFESATSVNAGAGVLIERCDNAGTVLSTIVANTTVPATITEWATGSSTKTGTYTPTSTAMAVGERIKVTVKVRNVGTMGAGSVTIRYNDSSDGTNNSWITFTEDIRTDEIIEVQQPEIYGSNGYRV
jgi:hypothetical protein